MREQSSFLLSSTTDMHNTMQMRQRVLSLCGESYSLSSPTTFPAFPNTIYLYTCHGQHVLLVSIRYILISLCMFTFLLSIHFSWKQVGLYYIFTAVVHVTTGQYPRIHTYRNIYAFYPNATYMHAYTWSMDPVHRSSILGISQ